MQAIPTDEPIEMCDICNLSGHTTMEHIRSVQEEQENYCPDSFDHLHSKSYYQERKCLFCGQEHFNYHLCD